MFGDPRVTAVSQPSPATQFCHETPPTPHPLRPKLLALLTSCGLTCFFFPPSFFFTSPGDSCFFIQLTVNHPKATSICSFLLSFLFIFFVLIPVMQAADYIPGLDYRYQGPLLSYTDVMILLSLLALWAAVSLYFQNCHELETLTPITYHFIK